MEDKSSIRGFCGFWVLKTQISAELRPAQESTIIKERYGHKFEK